MWWEVLVVVLICVLLVSGTLLLVFWAEFRDAFRLPPDDDEGNVRPPQ